MPLAHTLYFTVSSGHLSAVEKLDEIKGSEVYNLGTGRGVSVLEMVGEFEKASKAEIPYKIVERRKGDVAICFADPSKVSFASPSANAMS